MANAIKPAYGDRPIKRETVRSIAAFDEAVQADAAPGGAHRYGPHGTHRLVVPDGAR